jgi:hypothetical protein
MFELEIIYVLHGHPLDLGVNITFTFVVLHSSVDQLHDSVHSSPMLPAINTGHKYMHKNVWHAAHNPGSVIYLIS